MLLVIRNGAAATTVCGPAVAFSSRVTSHVHIIPERHHRDVGGGSPTGMASASRWLQTTTEFIGVGDVPTTVLSVSLRPGIRDRTVWLRPDRYFAELDHLMISFYLRKKSPADQYCHYSRNSLETN